MKVQHTAPRYPPPMRHRLRHVRFRLVAFGGATRLSLLLHPLLYRWTGGIGPLGHFLGNRVAIDHHWCQERQATPSADLDLSRW
jgi:hypothetical protein